MPWYPYNDHDVKRDIERSENTYKRCSGNLALVVALWGRLMVTEISHIERTGKPK